VERRTISIMKAGEMAGVSRRTIYNWLSAGKIEYVRTAGGSVRIFVDSLWRDANNATRPCCPTCFSGRGAELSSRERESEERDVKRKTLTSCS
jgi:excisionase family DNA binding protein